MTRETELEQQLADHQRELDNDRMYQSCMETNHAHDVGQLKEQLAEAQAFLAANAELAAQQTANAALELEVMRLREIAADIQGYFSKSSKIYCLCESALGNPQGLHALRDFATRIERATIERCAVEAERVTKYVNFHSVESYRQASKTGEEIRALPVGEIKLEEFIK